MAEQELDPPPVITVQVLAQGSAGPSLDKGVDPTSLDDQTLETDALNVTKIDPLGPPAGGSGAGSGSDFDSPDLYWMKEYGFPRPFDDELITRYLCASTHLQASFADEVVSNLTGPSVTAASPSWGVDLLALVRHASLSKRRRLRRDQQLRWSLGGIVGGTAFVFLLWALQVLTLPQTAFTSLVILVGCWVFAWFTVFNHYETIRLSALDVMDESKDGAHARELAPPVGDEDEAHLEELNHANVVVSSGYLPFVGSGATLDSWNMSINLEPDDDERAAAGDNSHLSFDALDIHRYLLENVPGAALPGVKGASRLYVNGAAAPSVPELVADLIIPPLWPMSRLPQETLDKYARNPVDNVRTYATFSKSTWRGELILSTLVRAEVTGKTLFIEGRSHALMPIQAIFREVKFVTNHPAWRFLHVAVPATVVTTPLLLGSFGRLFELREQTRTYRYMGKVTRRKIEQKFPFNYGSNFSIREQIAEVSELKHFAAADETMNFHRMRRQIMSTLGDFLRDRNVFMGEFNQQSHIVLNRTIIHLHDVGGSNDNFGKQNTVLTAAAVPPRAVK